MKTIKHFALLLLVAASFSSCVVRERRAGWVPGHYDVGPYGGRHWVGGHYAR
ncbi:MAG TPA: hypothetical protein VL490_00650 [Mucilaginibacter sp.]|jgi:hypothetical protein|nr:hypothetical protein [Mucilaginibacter sp.]